MTKSNWKKLSAIIAAIALAYTPVTLVSPAHAYDDDVDFVCGDTDDGDIYCVSVDDLKAECPLSDPEGVGEECAGLDKSKPGRGRGNLAKLYLDPPHRDGEAGGSSGR